jgi:hypothetical protein
MRPIGTVQCWRLAGCHRHAARDVGRAPPGACGGSSLWEPSAQRYHAAVYRTPRAERERLTEGRRSASMRGGSTSVRGERAER